MNGEKKILLLSIYILLLSVFAVQAQVDNKAAILIHDGIVAAGGIDNWQHNGMLVVHESQRRNEEGGIVNVNLVHYMDTMGKGYRIELSRLGENYVYGWDGKEFWATAGGKAGGHDLVNEARRVISDAYFRFSLPFVLDNSEQEYKYTVNGMLDGNPAEVINVTYAKGPADRYFVPAAEVHGHKSGEAEAGHGADSGGHGHGGEVYNFYFNQQKQIAKIYFSHHGDGTYETLLMEDFKPVDGITREHKRTLLRPDGQTHYVSDFTSIDFVIDIDGGLFSIP